MIMAKRHISVTVDEDVHDLAQKRNLNISAIMSQALYEKTFGIQTTIPIGDNLKCDFCGHPGEREKASDVEKVVNIKDPVRNPTLLTWLWPNEQWICNSCLRIKTRSVPAAGGIHQ